ncbi:MAG: polysaccharide ABC transporter ATP-binding protein [Bacteroidota bacterium]|nr:polysaccharide ABC transporter ATP-binding protein [Bacteroidota bacterium]
MALAIKVENLSKAYQLGEIGTGTLSRDLERWIAKMRGKEDPFLMIGETNDRTTKGASNVVWSLKDVNFEIEQGTAVGIIGRNGAGKSTLLKLLSRVTAPTSGSFKVKGRIASLLEVGTGFHPELTGRENIFLNGAILGMRKKEIQRKFDEIVDFAGVERYIDTPVKRYSSGMYVRLAFGVAAHLESEILIVDEVLAVGDAEFQKKCIGKMNDVSKGDGRTVLFVSHDLNAVSQLCSSAVLLKNGQVDFQGETTDVISTYLKNGKTSATYVNVKPRNRRVQIGLIEVQNIDGEICQDFLHKDYILLYFEITIKNLTVRDNLFVLILDSKKRRVFASESISLKPSMKLIIEPQFLVRGDYSVHAFINNPGFEMVDVVEDVCNFKIVDDGSIMAKHGEFDYGSVFGKYYWD